MARGMLAALAALSLCSCASIVRGGAPQAFSVRSNPMGAEVKIFEISTGTLIANGKTPFQTMLAKSRGYFQGQKYRVLLELPGFRPTEAIVDTSVNGWYVAGNLFFGGLIGWLIVDPATGAMWSLDQELLDVPLSPAGAPAPSPEKLPAAMPTSSVDGPCIGVIELASVPPETRSHMKRLN